MADSAISDPGPAGRSGGPDGPPGPDAELISALDDAVGRSVLAVLRSGPRSVGELTAATGHAEADVWAALHALTEQGVVAADHPRLPGEVVYRIDGAALIGWRGLGRWFRSRSSATADGRRSAAGEGSEISSADTAASGPSVRQPTPITGEPATGGTATGATVAGAAVDDDVAARSRPSVAAWTNPAVKAALRRLDEQQRRPG